MAFDMSINILNMVDEFKFSFPVILNTLNEFNLPFRYSEYNGLHSSCLLDILNTVYDI